jgi:NAD(P)-dependent dehydrogenase (short-subunit alcohol dehydrogenase family)
MSKGNRRGLSGLIPVARPAVFPEHEVRPRHRRLVRDRARHGAAARRGVVLISSVGGRVALPFTGAYHAAKFGLEALGDSLRQELAPWGIKVVLIEPGSIDTPIWSRGEEDADKILAGASPRLNELYGAAIERYREVVRDTAERGIPPEKVAAKIEHALDARRPRTRYLIGIDAQVMARLEPFLPTPVFDRLIAAAMGFPKPPNSKS